MELALEIWKQSFQNQIEIDWDTFITQFQNFIRTNAQLSLDDVQLIFLQKQIDPDFSGRIHITDFLIFFLTFWSINSKRGKIFNHQFIQALPFIMKQFKCLKITVIKAPSNTIKLLQKDSTIEISQYTLQVNGQENYNLKNKNICYFGSDLQKCDVVFPDATLFQPIQFSIGISSRGFYIRDIAHFNRAAFLVKEKSYKLDFQTVFKVGNKDKFMIKNITPIEPYSVFRDAEWILFTPTNEQSYEDVIVNFGELQKQKKCFKDVEEWRSYYRLDSYSGFESDSDFTGPSQRQRMGQQQNQQQEEVKDAVSDEIYQMQEKEKNASKYIEFECMEGDCKGQSFMIKNTFEPFIIGRDKKCNLQLKDMSVSKQHCQITFRKNWGWYLKELQPTLGTYIYLAGANQILSKLPSKLQYIYSNNYLTIGGYTFKLELIDN